MQKILFVNAIDYTDYGQRYIPALSFGYLMASIKQAFPNEYQFRYEYQEIEWAIDQWRPDIVMITSVSENWGRACKYAAIAKKYGTKVVVGGMHVSTLPETMTADMDIAVMGEGVQTIKDILSYLNNEKAMGYGDIPGIAFYQTYKGNNTVVTNPKRKVLPPSQIAHPDRSLFPHAKRQYMFTSFGCPYKCTFCASTRFWPELRFFSPEYVIEEIEELVSRGANQIEIWDDLFIADRRRFIRIAELVVKRGINKKVKFTCQSRANLIDDEICENFRRMGMRDVWMGLESGCPRTLEYLKGHSVTVADNRRAIELLRKHGIKPVGSFIIGSPHETKTEILETLEFIKSSDLATFFMHLMMPEPGTPIWDYALKRGLVSNDMDWTRLHMNHGDDSKMLILSETLSKRELKEIHELFVQEKFRKSFNRVLRNPFLIAEYPRAAWDTAIRILSGKGAFSQ